MEPGDPATVGGYVLVGRLGVAASGVTYLADGPGGEPVALKRFTEVVRSDERTTGFLRVVGQTPRLSVRSVADVLDGGVENGYPYVVSRYSDLPSFRAMLAVEGGGLPATRLLRFAVDTAKALSHIHGAGWYHGGLGAADVTMEPETDVLCLVDVLGPLRAMVSPDAASARTRGPSHGGMPGDVAAWGAIVLAAATGREDLAGDPVAIFRSALGGTPLASDLARIVARATAPRAQRRPSAALVVRWVERLTADSDRTRSDGSRTESRRCHVSAQASMQPEVEPDETALVTVSLAGQRLRHPDRPTATGADLTADPEEPLVVQAVGTTNIEVVGPDRFTVTVPARDETRAVAFQVRPAGVGRGTLAITISQHGLPLVEPLVLTPALPGRGGDRFTERAGPGAVLIAVGTIERLPTAADVPTWMLSIHEITTPGQWAYRYEIVSHRLEVLGTFVSDPIRGDRSTYLDDLYDQLEHAWRDAVDPTGYEEELRAAGGALFDDLIPEPLKRILWDHRGALRDILFVSDEPFIPWELLHLKAPAVQRLPDETYFLGEMGLVRWRWSRHPPNRLRIRRGRARHIMPTYPAPGHLPAVSREREFLMSAFASREVVPHRAEVLSVLQHEPFDLLHFSGHASARPEKIDDAQLLLEGRAVRRQASAEYVEEPLTARLVSQTFDRTAAWDDPHSVQPIVVINACRSGRAGYRLTRIGGFADVFVRNGAGAFVGTLWSVGDRLARVFLESFYSALLDGETIATAAIAGRRAARRAGDASWLAYVVYANPVARLERE